MRKVDLDAGDVRELAGFQSRVRQCVVHILTACLLVSLLRCGAIAGTVLIVAMGHGGRPLMAEL
jgi:hypothetical protein